MQAQKEINLVQPHSLVYSSGSNVLCIVLRLLNASEERQGHNTEEQDVLLIFYRNTRNPEYSVHGLNI